MTSEIPTKIVTDYPKLPSPVVLRWPVVGYHGLSVRETLPFRIDEILPPDNLKFQQKICIHFYRRPNETCDNTKNWLWLTFWLWSLKHRSYRSWWLSFLNSWIDTNYKAANDKAVINHYQNICLLKIFHFQVFKCILKTFHGHQCWQFAAPLSSWVLSSCFVLQNVDF